MFKFSEKQVKELLKMIHSGKIDKNNLPPNLYEAIQKYYMNGLLKGYGVHTDPMRLANLEDLKQNLQFFSAAKTYTQIRDIEQYIFNENGTIISLNQFQEIGMAQFDVWNKTYGEAEYTTIIGQAQQAERWQTIEENKDILPMLTFSTNGHACPECEPFNNMTRKVDDHVWNIATPLLHFRCACILIQSDDAEETSKADMKNMPLDSIPENFRNNPGKTGEIFTKDHPYFAEVSKEDIEFARNNFGLPID